MFSKLLSPVTRLKKLAIIPLFINLTSCSGISKKEATQNIYAVEGHTLTGDLPNARKSALKIPKTSQHFQAAQTWICVINEMEKHPEKYSHDNWRGSPTQKLIQRKFAALEKD